MRQAPQKTTTHGTETGPALAVGDGERQLLDQIAAAPRSAPLLWGLFERSKAQGHIAVALRALERIGRLGSDGPSFWSEIGIAYADLNHWDEAAAALQRAVDDGARDLPTLAHLAAIRLADERFADTTILLGMLQTAHPDAPQTLLLLGHLEKARGRLRQAGDAYRRALERHPALADAIFHLAEIADRAEEPYLDALLARAGAAMSADDPGWASLRFSEALLRERAGLHDLAFEAYRAANDSLRKGMAERGILHDPIAYERRLAGIIAATPVDIRRSALPPTPLATRPIFIVGMPRSGTTLVDQIIGRHPMVAQAGELTAMPMCVGRFLKARHERGIAADVPWGAAAPDQGLLLETRERYLEQVFDRGVESERFTDKLPGNFENVAMIRLLFPDAVIVHCRRHAVATCWSIYATNLGAHEPYSTSLEHIADVHRGYRRLMAHWRGADIGGLVEVDYEALVADPPATIKALVGRCGLPWDDACLDPAGNPRAVVTASAAQVRRGIYAASLERWRPYARHLRALTALDEQDDGCSGTP